MQGLIQGTTHLCQGQEAVSVGAVAALRRRRLPDDHLPRARPRARARHVDGGMLRRADGPLDRLLPAASAARCTSPTSRAACSARSRSSVPGCRSPSARRYRRSCRARDSVALTFFGDGATNIGTFHEALNMASVWKVAVVFMIENNLYGEYTPAARDDAARRSRRARQGARDARRRSSTARTSTPSTRRSPTAVARARAGDGPTLIEMKTYRYRGHSRTDPAKYRPEGELERWKERDPIDLLGAQLAEDGDARRAEQAALRAEVQDASTTSAERAQQAPFPTLEEIRSLCLRSLKRTLDGAPRGRGRDDLPRGRQRRARATSWQPIRRVLLMGEDVANAGGVFKTNDGLPEAFGRARREHADLRERLHRRRARHVRDRAAAGRRDHVQRLPADRRRRDRRTSCRSSASCPAASARARHRPLDRRRRRAASARSTRRPASRGSWAFPA